MFATVCQDVGMETIEQRRRRLYGRQGDLTPKETVAQRRERLYGITIPQNWEPKETVAQRRERLYGITTPGRPA